MAAPQLEYNTIHLLEGTSDPTISAIASVDPPPSSLDLSNEFKNFPLIYFQYNESDDAAIVEWVGIAAALDAPVDVTGQLLNFSYSDRGQSGNAQNGYTEGDANGFRLRLYSAPGEFVEYGLLGSGYEPEVSEEYLQFMHFSIDMASTARRLQQTAGFDIAAVTGLEFRQYLKPEATSYRFVRHLLCNIWLGPVVVASGDAGNPASFDFFEAEQFRSFIINSYNPKQRSLRCAVDLRCYWRASDESVYLYYRDPVTANPALSQFGDNAIGLHYVSDAATDIAMERVNVTAATRMYLRADAGVVVADSAGSYVGFGDVDLRGGTFTGKIFGGCDRVKAAGATLINPAIQNTTDTHALMWTAGAVTGAAFTGNPAALLLPVAGVFDVSSFDFGDSGAWVTADGVDITLQISAAQDAAIAANPALVEAINGGSLTLQAPQVSIDVGGMVEGSRYQLYNVDDAVEIANAVAGAAAVSVPFTAAEAKTIRLRIAAGGKLPLQVLGSFNPSAGASFIADQQSDPVFAAIATDPATVTEFSDSFGNGIHVTVNPALVQVAGTSYGVTSWLRLYVWFMARLATASGIANYSMDSLKAVANRFNYEIRDFTVRNSSTTLAVVFAESFARRADGQSWIDVEDAIAKGTQGIFVDLRDLVYSVEVAGGGGDGGLTTTQENQLAAIATKTDALVLQGGAVVATLGSNDYTAIASAVDGALGDDFAALATTTGQTAILGAIAALDFGDATAAGQAAISAALSGLGTPVQSSDPRLSSLDAPISGVAKPADVSVTLTGGFTLGDKAALAVAVERTGELLDFIGRGPVPMQVDKLTGIVSVGDKGIQVQEAETTITYSPVNNGA